MRSSSGGLTQSPSARKATVAEQAARGTKVRELDTPALLLDIGAVERNLARMGADCRALGKSLRPHAKSHKSPILARRQVDAGAVGITCAKIAEAEVMVDGGIDDILVSTVVGSPRKAARLARLARSARVTAVVDSREGADWLSAAATAEDARVDVLVDVNVGQDRTGVEPADAAALAAHVAKLPSLALRGLQGYEGHLQHVYDLAERTRRSAECQARLAEACDALRRAGLPTDIVSTAGTGTYLLAGRHEHVSELQPGSYVVMDADYARVEGLPFEIGLVVLTTVIGRYPGRVIVDAGFKALSTDAGLPVVEALPGARYAPAGDEHGALTGEGVADLRVGDRLEIFPSHCDTTVNLHDEFVVLRDGTVEDVWPIAARGRTQ